MDILKKAKAFEIDTSEDSWYDLWHTHLDHDGIGNESPATREQYLSALFIMFEKINSQAKTWSLEHNIWVLIDPNNSCDDSLYIHTPNPNKNVEFPYSFEGVSWGQKPPDLISHFINENLEVGISNYNDILYWIRECK